MTKLEVVLRMMMRPTTLVMRPTKEGVLIMNGFRMYRRMYRLHTQELITSVVDAYEKYIVVRVCDAQ